MYEQESLREVVAFEHHGHTEYHTPQALIERQEQEEYQQWCQDPSSPFFEGLKKPLEVVFLQPLLSDFPF